MDPNGTELDRISGWDGNKEKFSETLKDYLQGIGTLKALLAEGDYTAAVKVMETAVDLNPEIEDF